MAHCEGINKKTGERCKANAPQDRAYCRWHDSSPEARAAHIEQSRKGGEAKAYGALVSTDPLASDPAVAALDLTTADGIRGLLGAMLRAMTRLPVDVRLANALGNLATAQRAVIDLSDVSARLEALEQAQKPRPPAQQRW